MKRFIVRITTPELALTKRNVREETALDAVEKVLNKYEDSASLSEWAAKMINIYATSVNIENSYDDKHVSFIITHTFTDDQGTCKNVISILADIQEF